MACLAPVLALAAAQATAPAPFTVSVQFDDGALDVRDARDGTPLILPWTALRPEITDVIVPSLRCVVAPRGFDLQLTYANGTEHPAAAGPVDVGLLDLGPRITWQDFAVDGQPRVADASAGTVSVSSQYPLRMYSPVAVVRNERHAVGMSLHYPLLEDRHDVAWRLAHRVLPDGRRGWTMSFGLSNRLRPRSEAPLAHPAVIPAGATCRYVVAVRFSDRPDAWPETLAPYAAYFQGLYGDVRYRRDPRPVRGVVLAQKQKITEQNRYGFGAIAHRPDVNGWRPFADELATLLRRWDRVMIWAPTGLFTRHQENNFPFRFTSHWEEGERYGHHMADAANALRAVPLDGDVWGLWWGRACQVMPEWDTATAVNLDPEDAGHVTAAERELDGAARAGARMIGLDAFTHRRTPAWALFGWLEHMQRRHPEIRFITEGRCPDVLHVLAPTWIDAYRQPSPRRPTVRHVQTGLVLADLVVPGHETWAGLQFGRMRAAGGAVTPALMRREVQRIAALGYVPVVFQDGIVPPGTTAAETGRAGATDAGAGGTGTGRGFFPTGGAIHPIMKGPGGP